ncbi:MAG: lipid A deacylase LpxR family protein [Flavobacteriales bacterium]|nr:lipid A deacylase LpxR family protein [Flavobacteriales bacterium]MBP9078972.1 lipid A deacylase LpxR family protein [Flavobacteriales bacterium]
MNRIIGTAWLAALLPLAALAQTPASPSMQVAWDNDYLIFKGDGTDRYYTNGVRVEYFFRREKRNFLQRVLLQVADDDNLYGLGLAQHMFTPSRINIAEVQPDDRPYAGALFAIHSLRSMDRAKRMTVTTEMNIGVIGPLSMAGQAQTWVHGAIGYTIPEGWGNQVPNDIILNYNLEVEREVVHVPGKLIVSGIMDAYAGTLYDAMGAGFSLRMGRVQSPYDATSEASNGARKYQLYLLMRPTARVIYYNALLQGGIMHHITASEEGYTLGKDQMERISAFTEVGVVYERPKLSIKLAQKMRTAPFKGGHALEYGSVTAAFNL